MKQFLISYTFTEGSEEEWHQKVREFIENLKTHPLLAGKISYTCFKSKKDASYYHLAQVVDEDVVKTLGEQDFFTAYTRLTEQVGGGNVTVTPLEVIAQTGPLA